MKAQSTTFAGKRLEWRRSPVGTKRVKKIVRASLKLGFPTNGGRDKRWITLSSEGVAMQYRRYEKQFREQAMNLVIEQGREVCTVARDLGMPHSTLFKWLRERGWTKPIKADQGVPLPEDPAALKVLVAQLQGKVHELEMDREILKKATAFFANQKK